MYLCLKCTRLCNFIPPIFIGLLTNTRTFIFYYFILYLFSSPELCLGWAFVIVECPAFVVRCVSCVVKKSSGHNLPQTCSECLSWWYLSDEFSHGWVGSKGRSLCQILVNYCLHSRGHIFCPIFFKLAQNICLDNISIKFNHGRGQIKM